MPLAASSLAAAAPSVTSTGSGVRTSPQPSAGRRARLSTPPATRSTPCTSTPSPARSRPGSSPPPRAAPRRWRRARSDTCGGPIAARQARRQAEDHPEPEAVAGGRVTAPHHHRSIRLPPHRPSAPDPAPRAFSSKSSAPFLIRRRPARAQAVQETKAEGQIGPKPVADEKLDPAEVAISEDEEPANQIVVAPPREEDAVRRAPRGRASSNQQDNRAFSDHALPLQALCANSAPEIAPSEGRASTSGVSTWPCVVEGAAKGAVEVSRFGPHPPRAPRGGRHPAAASGPPCGAWAAVGPLQNVVAQGP